MAIERFKELSQGGIGLLVPQEVVIKIEGSFTDFREASTWREDLPHGLPHVLEALSLIKHFHSERPFLNPVDAWRAFNTIIYHDKGQIFVNKGVLKPDEHHFGSIYYAWRAGIENQVLAAISLHVLDVLPPKTPVWVKAARDFDRVSRLGYTGANNMAYYVGFWEKELDLDELERYMNQRILCEDQYPGLDDLEADAKRFFDLSVMPFLYGKGEKAVDRMIAIMEEMERRALGDTRLDMEPVMREIREDCDTKFKHTEEVLRKLYWISSVIGRHEEKEWEEWFSKVNPKKNT